MSLPSPVNPFEESTDPRGYVSRVACEETLRSLLGHAIAGVPVILLRGPAGIGKSMLLRVLQERIAGERRLAYVSVSPSPAPEISHRILDLLSEPVDEDPPSSVVAAARRSALAGRPVLVIIDHATGAPIASSLQLARAAAQARPDLCILFAVSDERGADDFEREISGAGELVTVRFEAPMDDREAMAYIEQRLGSTPVPDDLRARLDAAGLRWVIDGSHGLPRAVNARASELLRRLASGEALPPAAGGEFGSASRDHAPRQSTAPDDWSPHAPESTAGAAAASVASLGGGLLGAGLRPDLDDAHDPGVLFPPGFLGSSAAPPEMPRPPEAPSGAPRVPDPADEPEQSAAQRIGAAVQSAVPVEATTLDDGHEPAQAEARADDAMSPRARPITTPAARPAQPEQSSPYTPRSPAPAATAWEGGAARSSTRSRLSVAALVVTALAGGYLAGRVELGGDEPSPQRVDVRAPTSLVAESTRPAPSPSPRPPGRPQTVTADRPVPPEPGPPTPESSPSRWLPAYGALMPETDIDDTSPPAPAGETPAAEPQSPSTVEAKVAALAAAPIVATAARLRAPEVPAAAPPVATASKPAPAAERLAAEPDSKAPAPRAVESAQPREPPAPATSSAVEDALAVASATAIVVGARSQGQPGGREIAYVRVKVDLEPGAILTVDGEQVGVAPISDLIMEPGLHTFVAELPDGLQIEQLIDVTATTGVVGF